jgi:hypothetical protein
LTQFVDYSSGFIVEKLSTKVSTIGYPGLDGTMANWITIVLSRPQLISFNPVKTVNDLLKPAHQS